MDEYKRMFEDAVRTRVAAIAELKAVAARGEKLTLTVMADNE